MVGKLGNLTGRSEAICFEGDHRDFSTSNYGHDDNVFMVRRMLMAVVGNKGFAI